MKHLFINVQNNGISFEVAYILRKIQISRVNNSRTLRIKNGKSSGYCFYMNPNILRNFQICISVLLSGYYLTGKSLLSNFSHQNRSYYSNRLILVAFPINRWLLLADKTTCTCSVL